jgi:hypothetical protein
MANEHDEQLATATPAEAASPAPAAVPEAGAATAMASGLGNAAFTSRLTRPSVSIGRQAAPPARPAAPSAAVAPSAEGVALARIVRDRRGDTVARKALSEEMRDAAERSDERDDEKEDPMVKQVSAISSVGDAMSASMAIRTIDGATKVLQSNYAIDDGATPEHVAQNATTQGHLEILIDRSNVLDLKADRFSQVYKMAIRDFERLDAAVSAFITQHGPPGGVEVDDRGKLKWSAKQVTDEATKGMSPDKRASETPERREAEAAMRDTKGVLDRLKNLSGTFDANVAGLGEASAAVRSDEGRIPNDEKDNPNVKKVQAEAAAFKATVGTVLSMLKGVAARLPIGAAAVEALGQGRPETQEERAEAGAKVYKAEDVDKKIQDISIPDFVSLEKLVFGDKQKLAAAIDADDMTKKVFAHTQQALLRVEEKTAQLATTMADIKAAIKDLEVQTARIRKASQAAGEEYDKRHGTKGKGAAAGVLYGEASAFAATAQAAHDQGQREKAEAGRVEDKRGEISTWQDPNKSGAASGMVDPAGMRYFYHTRDKPKGKGYIGTGHINAQALKQMTLKDSDSAKGAVETGEKALTDLKSKHDQAQEMRTALGKMLGMF